MKPSNSQGRLMETQTLFSHAINYEMKGSKDPSFYRQAAAFYSEIIRLPRSYPNTKEGAFEEEFDNLLVFKSKIRLSTLFENGLGVPKSKEKANDILKDIHKYDGSWREEDFFNAGFAFEHGLTFQKDFKKAQFFYKQCRKTWLSHCPNWYLSDNNREKFIPQRYMRAACMYRSLAEKGELRALAYLGFCYEKGIGVSQNIETAKKLYQEASYRGNVFAMAQLGEMLLSHPDVKPNFKRAHYWLEKAAQAGNPQARLALCKAYRNGLGVPKDQRMASSWYQKVSQTKSFWNKEGWYFYAPYYLGLFHKKDHPKKALKWFLKAIECTRTRRRARIEIGLLYLEGPKGISKDYQKAEEYFQAAYKLGSVRAAYYLGQIYEMGLGVNADPKKADDFYKMAALQGHFQAMEKLGFHSLNDMLTLKDLPTDIRMTKASTMTWFHTLKYL